jgi:hypothetical protein
MQIITALYLKKTLPSGFHKMIKRRLLIGNRRFFMEVTLSFQFDNNYNMQY